jgi:toxin ParE1/3/4
MLSDHPHAGQRRTELRPCLRSFPVGNYLIFYRPLRGGVELVRVLHGARDVRRSFDR